MKTKVRLTFRVDPPSPPLLLYGQVSLFFVDNKGKGQKKVLTISQNAYDEAKGKPPTPPTHPA